MNNNTKPLWVIEFNNMVPRPPGGPIPIHMSVPEGETLEDLHVGPPVVEDKLSELPNPIISEEVAMEFMAKMQECFEELMNSAKDTDPDAPQDLEELEKGLESLRNWVKDFQKFLNNPPEDPTP